MAALQGRDAGTTTGIHAARYQGDVSFLALSNFRLCGTGMWNNAVFEKARLSWNPHFIGIPGYGGALAGIEDRAADSMGTVFYQSTLSIYRQMYRQM